MHPIESTAQDRLQTGNSKDSAESAVQIQVVDPLGQSDWDSQLLSHPDFSFFHGTAWAQVLNEAYRFLPCYLVALRRNRLTGLLPIMEARSPFTGVRGVSLPFTDECPPLSSSTIEASALMGRAIEEGKARRWRYCEFRGIKPGAVSRSSLEFHGHRLQLCGDVELLFERFDGSVRRAIKKAERSVKVELGRDGVALRMFYGLHCGTRKKHGVPPQPYSFFDCIQRHIFDKGNGFVALAMEGRLPIAGAVFFHLGKKAIYKFGASNERFQHLRGSNLVMWEGIKWLVHNGFTELNFGKTSLCNEGLRRFKQGWGPEEYRLSYAKYDYRSGQFVQDRDLAHSWQNHFFRRLPLSLLRMVGQLCYRHLV